jgi:hypothetical protein
MIQEFLLQWVELITNRHTLNRGNFLAFDFGCEHETSANQTSVQRYATGTTVTRCTPLFTAGQS